MSSTATGLADEGRRDVQTATGLADEGRRDVQTATLGMVIYYTT